MKDKELIEKAMELAKHLDLARSRHYADTIRRLVKRVEELQNNAVSFHLRALHAEQTKRACLTPQPEPKEVKK